MSQRFTSHPTRRKFLRQAGLLSLASSLPASQMILDPTQASAATSETPVAVQHRAPLHPGAFSFLPLGTIQPQGWLRRQLRIQASGLSGHLDEVWSDVGPESGWLGGKGESWERGPYYVDGLVPLAWLLNDSRLKLKAQKYIDWTLEHQAASGMLGPSSNNDWWPRIVMLKALTQYQEFTSDPRVIPALDRYFRYQLSELPQRPLRDWGRFRWQDELLSVIWLYDRTGAAYLLDLSRLLHAQGYDWIAQYEDFKFTGKITAELLKLDKNNGLTDLALATHGVNNGQAIKTGPVWSLVSGSATDRNAVVKMLAALDRYHGMPNGMFSCDEHLAGLDPSQGSELCTVVETMFSLEQALAIVGDPVLADRLEKVAFNALPGTFDDAMWAHQYNQESNQVECSLHHKPWVTDGPESNLFGLEPNFGCCTANFHQGWPKLVTSLFLLAPAFGPHGLDGLAAAVYAPCTLNTKLNGVAVQVVEETDYPFHGRILLTVNPGSPVRFPLHLRIPGWAAGATIRVNGKAEPAPDSGSFSIVERTWKQGDRVELLLPLKPRVSRWFHNSAAIERGPVVFSLGIGEDWVKLRDRGMTADWQVFPRSAWNYALEINPSDPAKSIDVIESEVGAVPFSRADAAVRLSLKGRQVNAWRAVDGAADPLPESPVTSDASAETLTLIPYAAAKLRITAFPTLRS